MLKIDDRESLAVLQAFEQHLQERNVRLALDSYEQYFRSISDCERINGPDWRKDYSSVCEQRWSKVTDFLAGQGLVLG